MFYDVPTAKVIFTTKTRLADSVLDENMFGLVQFWVIIYL